ncbi:MAG: hypothetical protein A2066_11635 [Bacteroidetes bacterium GWB2_41_8]|nr:MAG: hypothetical protein A2066_11635 [Bacteroidetes bacterium GWB2_41_8]
MYYIIGLLILIVVVLVVILVSTNKQTNMAQAEQTEAPRQIASDCCGAHEICELDEADFNEEVIIYFEDEELDRLRNVRESDLTTDQIDELREVLYTLRSEEISKWMTSLSRRHIHLPAILQQEARMLLAEG